MQCFSHAQDNGQMNRRHRRNTSLSMHKITRRDWKRQGESERGIKWISSGGRKMSNISRKKERASAAWMGRRVQLAFEKTDKRLTGSIHGALCWLLLTPLTPSRIGCVQSLVSDESPLSLMYNWWCTHFSAYTPTYLTDRSWFWWFRSIYHQIVWLVDLVFGTVQIERMYANVVHERRSMLKHVFLLLLFWQGSGSHLRGFLFFFLLPVFTYVLVCPRMQRRGLSSKNIVWDLMGSAGNMRVLPNIAFFFDVYCKIVRHLTCVF